MLRAPICAVMGHVDAGKTSLIDALTSAVGVPQGKAQREAGGITQGISATYLSTVGLQRATSRFNSDNAKKGKPGPYDTSLLHTELPGMLLLDTPGHQAFGNFRERGAVLCDLALVVIDITQGLQPQTRDTLKLLQAHKVPFVVVLTKLDQVWDWKTVEAGSLKSSYKRQSADARSALEGYMDTVCKQLKKEFKLKTSFYLTNKKPEANYSVVACNSIKGEGIADLLALMAFTATKLMSKRLRYQADQLRGSVMESHYQPKLGWTVDLVLSNGRLNEGAQVYLVTSKGPVQTTIRSLQTVQVERERQVWSRTAQVQASCLVRIMAAGLEGVVAGTQLHQSLVAAQAEFDGLELSIERSSRGVILAAPTLGALQAFKYLVQNRDCADDEGEGEGEEGEGAAGGGGAIRPKAVQDALTIRLQHVGPVMERDLVRWAALPNQETDLAAKTICYFGQLAPELEAKAHALGLTLLQDEVVYRLLDQCQEHLTQKHTGIMASDLKASTIVWPCKLSMLEQFILVKGGSTHLLMGCKVTGGSLKLGTPVVALTAGGTKRVELGDVVSMQRNHKEVTEAKLGDQICIKFSNPHHFNYGRQFTHTDPLVSLVTPDSVRALIKHYGSELSTLDRETLREVATSLNHSA